MLLQVPEFQKLESARLTIQSTVIKGLPLSKRDKSAALFALLYKGMTKWQVASIIDEDDLHFEICLGEPGYCEVFYTDSGIYLRFENFKVVELSLHTVN
jgi:hypothetical protein